MQTFLPYPSFTESAKCLDTKRLGKQRVEGLQILQALIRGPYSCANCLSPEVECKCANRNIRATPWYNHPATQMWKDCGGSLIYYTMAMCDEWIARGYEDNIKLKVASLSSNFPSWKFLLPPLINYQPFHDSHKAALLMKNPKHYSQFNWNVEPKVDYVWRF